MFCCCFGTKREVSPEPEVDRVEAAFKRMDRNMDGFLTWEEFKRVTLPLQESIMQFYELGSHLSHPSQPS